MRNLCPFVLSNVWKTLGEEISVVFLSRSKVKKLIYFAFFMNVQGSIDVDNKDNTSSDLDHYIVRYSSSL